MTYFLAGLIAGFGLIALRAWTRYRQYGTRANQAAIAAMWEADQNAEALNDFIVAKQLEEDGRPSWLP